MLSLNQRAHLLRPHLVLTVMLSTGLVSKAATQGKVPANRIEMSNVPVAGVGGVVPGAVAETVMREAAPQKVHGHREPYIVHPVEQRQDRSYIILRHQIVVVYEADIISPGMCEQILPDLSYGALSMVPQGFHGHLASSPIHLREKDGQETPQLCPASAQRGDKDRPADWHLGDRGKGGCQPGIHGGASRIRSSLVHHTREREISPDIPHQRTARSLSHKTLSRPTPIAISAGRPQRLPRHGVKGTLKVHSDSPVSTGVSRRDGISYPLESEVASDITEIPFRPRTRSGDSSKRLKRKHEPYPSKQEAPATRPGLSRHPPPRVSRSCPRHRSSRRSGRPTRWRRCPWLPASAQAGR